MMKEMMSTKEVAEYLNINEKQVYALIKAKRIPATRVTGKWIFPKKIIDEWITSNAEKGIMDIREKSGDTGKALLASGSNDPVLDILLNNIKKINPDFYIFSSSIGSKEGLRLLNEGLTDIAWCHILDPESGEYNIPYISSYLPEEKIAIVHLFYREQGFLVSPQLKHNVKEFKDLCKNNLRFVNRQKGSGTRILLDYNLNKNSINPDSIDGYDNEVYTHFEVGLSILSGKSDVGIATIAISKLLDIPFVPIVKESFDMVLKKETFFTSGVQTFIETLKSNDFRDSVRYLGDYDFNDSGKIINS
ncbi:substrate-binding domain-containing protein [Spirochaetota bacterium]